jgi:hypothetical protein
MFSQPRDVNAIGSHFIDVGRDHNTNSIVNNIIIVRDDVALQIVGHHLSFPVNPSRAASSSDIVLGLIVEIVQSLMDPRSQDSYRGVKRDLRSLQQTIILTVLAVQAYESTPLCRTLVKAINREMENCEVVLRALRDAIHSFTQVLKSTHVGYVLRNFWASAQECDEVISIRDRLSKCHSSA